MGQSGERESRQTKKGKTRKSRSGLAWRTDLGDCGKGGEEEEGYK